MTGPTRVRITGPLAPFAAGFTAQLAEQGYTPGSTEAHVRLLAHLSRWLAGRGLEGTDLTPGEAERFLRERRRAGYVTKLSRRGLAPVLRYLGGLALLPLDADVAPGSLDELLGDFCQYLRDERGLAAGSIELYAGVARRFLAERSTPIGDDLARLSGADLSAFILRQRGRRGVASAKTAVCALRSLLRFLYVAGRIPRPLAAAVPAVANRRGGFLPRGLEPSQVARLLASCDRATALGRRDFAILTVLARLGLRAGEVAALELGDLDWRAGEVVIRGKGPRLERLPQPPDVGAAIADYLRQGRPRARCRRLFLRSCAPLVGLSRAGPTAVVVAACRRAGVPPVGAHRLRHSVATELLRRGAALTEIGQVLRHRSLATTAIYAKVDRVALATLALPWPGAPA